MSDVLTHEGLVRAKFLIEQHFEIQYYKEMFIFLTDIWTRTYESFKCGSPIHEEARCQEVVKALDKFIFNEKDGADFV